MKTKLVILSMLLPLLFSCAPSQRFSNRKSDSLIGFATYYGPGFHGKKTASGEIFNMNKMTCAHRTLPFGTKLLVTNLSNNKSVVVRVNDRGPFVKGVILDLSKAAAQKIVLGGKAKVKMEIFK